jgi:Fe-Mn family superoxide dismutase
MTLSRYEWLKIVGGSAVASLALLRSDQGAAAESPVQPGGIVPYALPDLPYKPNALEPHLNAEIVTIHHDKHHAAYVKGLNTALAGLEEARKKGDFSGVQALSRALAFHGSGHILHTLYFANLAPKSTPPDGALLDAIKAQFGSVETLTGQMSEATSSVAGSGWGVLAYEPIGRRLLVMQVEKHENQVLCGAAPLLVIDAWEHAYYLQYQNRRPDYIKAIWNVINWEEAGRRFEKAMKI